MKTCKPFNEFHYRVFEHYFGKFEETSALCDVYDKQTGDRLIKILSEYYKERPFHFFLKEIVYDKQKE